MKRSIHDNGQVLLAVLKKQARKLGITQAQIASELHVSLSSVKRWFQGEGVSLDALIKLMNALSLSFRELAELCPEEMSKGFTYSLVQERFFVSNPSGLAYFDLLLAGESAQRIGKKYRLSARATQRYLFSLEKIGLIEVLPGNRVKLKVEGEPQWLRNGPLATHFKKRGIQEFLTQAQDDANGVRMGLYRLMPSDREKIKSMLNDLLDYARAAETRAKFIGQNAAGYGLLLGFSAFEWSLLTKIENR